MKNYETREVVRKESNITTIVCDFCKAEREYGYAWKEVFDTERASHYQEETEPLVFKIGEYFPEYGEGRQWELDICPKCFGEKILPLVITEAKNGSEWDY